ncbi:hypothetical protein ABZ848_46155 [Streptomyces sp. NPDC047081]|uniref:hypothetical protein n=1 Tax=Streptomyces sp. NPDC047081 TaxID=3154706 RepID=UPI00340F05B9
MPYEVELLLRVEEAPAELPESARQELMEVIAMALVRPSSWPAPGGWATIRTAQNTNACGSWGSRGAVTHTPCGSGPVQPLPLRTRHSNRRP